MENNFSHSSPRNASSSSSTSAKRGKNDSQRTREKKFKKPKHLKRKIEQAEADNNELALQLKAEKDKLENTKHERKVRWEAVCKKLLGAKWDQAKFDTLAASGCSKKAFLAALGVEDTKQKKSRKKPRAPKGAGDGEPTKSKEKTGKKRKVVPDRESRTDSEPFKRHKG